SSDMCSSDLRLRIDHPVPTVGVVRIGFGDCRGSAVGVVWVRGDHGWQKGTKSSPASSQMSLLCLLQRPLNDLVARIQAHGAQCLDGRARALDGADAFGFDDETDGADDRQAEVACHAAPFLVVEYHGGTGRLTGE